MNRGQKLNTIVTAAFAILFAVSGFLLWYGERDTRFRFASTLLVHDWLMYVSFVLFLGHLYYALILPIDAALAHGNDARLGARGLGRAPPPALGGGAAPERLDDYVTLSSPFMPAAAWPLTVQRYS